MEVPGLEALSPAHAPLTVISDVHLVLRSERNVLTLSLTPPGTTTRRPRGGSLTSWCAVGWGDELLLEDRRPGREDG
jgi:hypothetical protein